MINCPNCGYEIDGEYFECSYNCSSTEIWWCDECGAIAYGWKGYPPDENDWILPNREKE